MCTVIAGTTIELELSAKSHPQVCATMVLYVWLEGPSLMKEEWKCVLMEAGEQCALIIGTHLMLLWCVVSLDISLWGLLHTGMLHLDQGLDQCGYRTSCVQEVSSSYSTALLWLPLMSTVIIIMM